jgi:hypothetical protein
MQSSGYAAALYRRLLYEEVREGRRKKREGKGKEGG